MRSLSDSVLKRLRPAMPAWRSASGMELAFGSVVDEASTSLQIVSVVGAKTRALNNLEVVAGTGVGGKVLTLARPTSVHNYQASTGITHHYDAAVRREGLMTVAAVPIIVAGKSRAVVYLASTSELALGDRWFNELDPLRRRLQHEILVEDEVQSRLEDIRAASRMVRTPPTTAELAAVVRELGQVSAELGTSEISARIDRIRRRLDGGAAIDQGASLPDGEYLTRREMQVLVEAAQGFSNRQIAENLGLLPNTVKSYLQDLMRKLDCSNRVQAIAYARTAGWID